MRRASILLTWLTVTVVASALGWAAVSRLGHNGPNVLSAAAIDVALRQSPPSTAPSTGEPTGAAPVPDAQSPPTAGAAPAPPSPGSSHPPGTSARTPSPSSASVPTVAPTAGPTPAPTTTAVPREEPSTTSTSRPSKVINAVGGVTSVECQGNDIRLLSTSPKNGFSQEVDSAGPGEVEVKYQSSTHRSEVHASCQGGRPVSEVDEASEGSSGTHDD